MKLFTRRIDGDRANRLKKLSIGAHLPVLAAVGIVLSCMMSSAIQAGTVVRLEFNYTDTTDSNLNYIDIELYDTEAPITVANFIKYVNNGLYDNTLIHRSVDSTDEYGNTIPFVVQGGGYSPVFEDGYLYDVLPVTTYAPIVNEYSASRSNVLGTVAMAKLGDDPDSATSQWFVNLSNNSANLDSQNGGFTVFGAVIGNGMTLVDGIHDLETVDYGSPFDNFPVLADGSSPVIVTSAKVISEAAGKLSGSVYVDMNKDGIMDGGDYGIAGVTVSLTLDGQNSPATVVQTGSDGSYSFTGLGSGSYSVKMETQTSVAGQDYGAGRIVVDENGNILTVGTSGDVQENSYGDVWLGDAQSGTNFNFAQDAYPVEMISARMLLNKPPKIEKAGSIAVPTAGTGDAGYVLVGKTGIAMLSVSNAGSEGSTLSGAFSNATDEFSYTDQSGMDYGPLAPGEESSREYTFTPTTRGEVSQSVAVTANGNTLPVVVSGTGVAPVSSVSDVSVYALVGYNGTAPVSIQNIGDGNLSGLGAESNLNGLIESPTGDFTGAGDSFSIEDGGSRTFDFTTPVLTERGGDPLTGTVKAIFDNGSVDGTNEAHEVVVNLTCTAVAPVSAYTQETVPYVLVKSTGSASVTIQNTGDGNLSGLGDESNLKGVLNDYTGVFNVTGGEINLEDDGSKVFTFNFSPTVKTDDNDYASATFQADFTNGSADGTNSSHTLDIVVTGIAVAPVQEVVTDAADAGYVRIGTSLGVAGITVNNIGNGNLSGLGEESNLLGTISSAESNFTGTGGDISMYDGNSESFYYTYTPLSHGTESETITVHFDNGSDDGTNSEQTLDVDITGYGVGPVFSSDIAPDSILDFGDVPQADTKSLYLEVSNITTDPNGNDNSLTDLTLVSATFSGDDAELFSVEGFTAGTVLQAGESLTLEIAYNGEGEHGDRVAVLTILTDEGVALGMSGNGFVWQIQASLQPEPGSLVLLAIAGFVIGGAMWRRRTLKDG